MSVLTFNENKHKYAINGRAVPGVTDMLDAVLGEPINRATDWHLGRGKAVHAAAALIAQGKEFEFDPQIEGYVRAIRKFFADEKPEVIKVEMRVCSELYQYAGTLDLLCVIRGKVCILDWKNSLEEERCKLQLGLYSLALKVDNKPVRWGIAVELHDDGSYRTPGLWDLRRAQQEALAIRTVYGILERMGRIERRKEQNNVSDG